MEEYKTEIIKRNIYSSLLKKNNPIGSLLGEKLFKLDQKEQSNNIFAFKIKKDNDIFLKYNPTLIIPKFIGNQGLFLKTETTVTPDNIAEFAYPIVQFMHQTSPDYVIACDRGARLLGLAVHLLYQELYGQLPTRNHSVMFRRISTSVPTEETTAHLKPDIDKMIAEVPNPKVLVLDDWVSSGRTKHITRAIFNDLSGGQAEVLYGVMRGPGGNITGKSDSAARAQWQDNPRLIGVDYSGTKPSRVVSENALRYRQRIATNIKEFADTIKGGNTTVIGKSYAEKTAQMKDAA